MKASQRGRVFSHSARLRRECDDGGCLHESGRVVGKTTAVNGRPMSLGMQSFGNAVRPDGAAGAQLRFVVSVSFSGQDPIEAGERQIKRAQYGERSLPCRSLETGWRRGGRDQKRAVNPVVNLALGTDSKASDSPLQLVDGARLLVISASIPAIYKCSDFLRRSPHFSEIRRGFGDILETVWRRTEVFRVSLPQSTRQ